jgi:hypothetical protein
MLGPPPLEATYYSLWIRLYLWKADVSREIPEGVVDGNPLAIP